jgi:hypothetical protein
MSTEKLQIVKDGKLIETRWIYDEKTEAGEYKKYDRTDRAIAYLFESCSLEEGVTLKDIFLLLNTELELFDLVIGNWCKDIVTEGLTKPEKPHDLSTYNPEQIEYLCLSFDLEYEEDGGINELYGMTRPDFRGVGVELLNDFDFYKKGNRISWGVSLAPSNNLINIPVRLENKLVIYEGILKAKEGELPAKLGEFDNPTYSLGQILESIIWELSFHGSPKDRDSMGSNLEEMVDKIQSGEAETVPYEREIK